MKMPVKATAVPVPTIDAHDVSAITRRLIYIALKGRPSAAIAASKAILDRLDDPSEQTGTPPLTAQEVNEIIGENIRKVIEIG